MSRLSILIPTQGVAECEDLLVSVLQNRPRGAEVVVVHSVPYNDPYDLSSEVRFVPVDSHACPVSRINAGLNTARGEVVHLLGSQMRVTEGWTNSAVARFEQPNIASVCPLAVTDKDATQGTIGVSYQAGGVRRESKLDVDSTSTVRQLSILGPTLRAGFFRRSAVLDLGGFNTSVGNDLADVDMALSLREAGWQAAVEPQSRVIDLGPKTQTAASFASGVQAERLFWRHSQLQGGTLSLVSHVGTVVSELLSPPSVGALTRLCGRMLASLELGTSARHVRTIEAIWAQRDEANENPSILKFPSPKQAYAGDQRRAA